MSTEACSKSRHYVFMTDDDGMQLAFPQIKNRLQEPGGQHVTLIYYTREGLFKKELNILLIHFPTQLIVFYREPVSDPPEMYREQELPEVILNSNTRDGISFYIGCSEPLADTLRTCLLFLDIDSSYIQDLT